MKRSLFYVAFFDLIFVLFLAISTSFVGVVGEAFYYLAFLLPISLAVAIGIKGDELFSPPSLKIGKENLLLTLPSVAPTIAVIFLFSFVTALILSYFGGSSTSDVSGNIARVIFTHAFLTAVLEELLFRYIPLAYLAPHSKRGAVVLSALFFALAHCNPSQIPYAFAAGVVFAVLDIAFDSVLPSFIIHLVNNIFSIFWLRHGNNADFARIYIIVLVSLALVSLVPIFLMRKKYISKIKPVFQRD